MIEKVQWKDRHKRFTTTSVLNRQGQEVAFEGACWDLETYGQGMGCTDPVVLEASPGAFWWADWMERKGATSFG